MQGRERITYSIPGEAARYSAATRKEDGWSKRSGDCETREMTPEELAARQAEIQMRRNDRRKTAPWSQTST